MKNVTGRKAVTTPAAPKAERVEYLPLLLAALKEQGIKPKVRWAPSGGYATLLAREQAIGFVHKQTRTGMIVGPALPAGTRAKGFVDSKRKGRYGLVGEVKKEAEVALAVAALKLAAEKAAAGKAAKAAPKPARKQGQS
jgi:hypothetical protein